jgi:hypothetical protein
MLIQDLDRNIFRDVTVPGAEFLEQRIATLFYLKVKLQFSLFLIN